MPVIYKRPRSIAAKASFRVGFLCAIMLIVSWALHRFGTLSTIDAISLWFVISAIATLGLILSCIGFFMLWYDGSKGGKASFFGFWLNLFVLLPICFAAYRYVSLPQQYDVQTSDKTQLEWLSPPTFLSSSSGQVLLNIGNDRIYNELTERRYQGAIDRVYKSILAATKSEKFILIASKGDDFLAQTEDVRAQEDQDAQASQASSAVPIPAPLPDRDTHINSGAADDDISFDATTITLQFAKSSLILGVDHHILIDMREDEDATYVNMRAATEFGSHDLGLNGDLINRFLRKVDQNLQGLVGAN